MALKVAENVFPTIAQEVPKGENIREKGTPKYTKVMLRENLLSSS